jgi:hypothetical protein
LKHSVHFREHPVHFGSVGACVCWAWSIEPARHRMDFQTKRVVRSPCRMPSQTHPGWWPWQDWHPCLVRFATLSLERFLPISQQPSVIEVLHTYWIQLWSNVSNRVWIRWD